MVWWELEDIDMLKLTERGGRKAWVRTDSSHIPALELLCWGNVRHLTMYLWRTHAVLLCNGSFSCIHPTQNPFSPAAYRHVRPYLLLDSQSGVLRCRHPLRLFVQTSAEQTCFYIVIRCEEENRHQTTLLHWFDLNPESDRYTPAAADNQI